MSHPNYLEIEEQIVTTGIKPITPMYICIQVADIMEAKALAPQYIKEFTDKVLPYKVWYHSHIHNIDSKMNSPCWRVEI